MKQLVIVNEFPLKIVFFNGSCSREWSLHKFYFSEMIFDALFRRFFIKWLWAFTSSPNGLLPNWPDKRPSSRLSAFSFSHSESLWPEPEISKSSGWSGFWDQDSVRNFPPSRTARTWLCTWPWVFSFSVEAGSICPPSLVPLPQWSVHSSQSSLLTLSITGSFR